MTPEIIFKTFDKGIIDYFNHQGKDPDLIIVHDEIIDIITQSNYEKVSTYKCIRLQSSKFMDNDMCLMAHTDDIGHRFEMGFKNDKMSDTSYSIRGYVREPIFFTKLRIQPNA